MGISVGIVFSSDSSGIFDEQGLKDVDVLGDLRIHTFDTQEEADAFSDGVEAAVGYEECVVDPVGDRSLVSRISFGLEESRSQEFKEVEQNSVVEREAFEQGVEAGMGWMVYRTLDERQMDNHRQALTALLADGKEQTPENLVGYIKSLDQLEAEAED